MYKRVKIRMKWTYKKEYFMFSQQHGGLAGRHDLRRGGRDAQRPRELPQRGRRGLQVGAHQRHQRGQRGRRRAPRAAPALQRRRAVRAHGHSQLEELLHHLSHGLHVSTNILYSTTHSTIIYIDLNITFFLLTQCL